MSAPKDPRPDPGPVKADTGLKKPVTERALAQRINRALAKEGQALHANRSTERDIGGWYIVDLRHNRIEATHVELETLGRELGVMKPWECLAP